MQLNNMYVILVAKTEKYVDYFFMPIGLQKTKPFFQNFKKSINFIFYCCMNALIWKACTSQSVQAFGLAPFLVPSKATPFFDVPGMVTPSSGVQGMVPTCLQFFNYSHFYDVSGLVMQIFRCFRFGYIPFMFFSMVMLFSGVLDEATFLFREFRDFPAIFIDFCDSSKYSTICVFLLYPWLQTCSHRDSSPLG